MRVAAHTAIAAPRPVVWDHIVDPARHLEFMDGMTRWEIDGAHPIALGTCIAMRIRIGSVELGGRIVIVEFDPPGDMAWTSITGVEHRGRWRLRRCDGGRTQVELRVTYHAPGGILGYIPALVAAPIVKHHLQHSLTALTQQLEAPPPAVRGKQRAANERSTAPAEHGRG
jgi:polyketide cyclase/dehydrase/lipid transport protein